jgi:regulator of sigma E protease
MLPTWINDIGFFALLFFVLVFIHELGHFLMAKWVGIRVERFAIGMGPSLFSFKKGDTEYKLGILPLGGYVKMSGDDPSKSYSEEEKNIGFLTKTPPQKLLVVFGGPVFNLILPIFLFGLMLATGIPNLDPVVGTLESGKPAALAGLKSGDRILSVEGQPLKKFQQLEPLLEKSPLKPLAFKIQRTDLKTGADEVLEIPVQPVITRSKSKFGEDIDVPRIGVTPDFAAPVIYFVSDDSLAAKSGLQREDKIVRLGAVKITTMAQLREALELVTTGKLELEVERSGEKKTLTADLPAGKESVWDRFGFKPVELVIGHVEPKSPADIAGLKKGDYLLSIDQSSLNGFEDVAKIIKSSDGKPVTVSWIRDGQTKSATLAAEKTTVTDPMLGRDNPQGQEPTYRIGIGSSKAIDTVLSIEKSLNPIAWVARGFSETWSMASMTVQSLYKLFTGQLSFKLLGSPIMIYKVAGNSYRIAGGGYFGWISFLSNLALLSITLGLVNLLPVPVLDGGHATFFIIEWIRGRPVSLRFMEIAMQVGLFLLIALFGLVLMNDIHRYQILESVLKLFR